MAARAHSRTVWALAGALSTLITLGVVAAPAASADPAPQFCTLNISTGDFSCTTVDPAQAGPLARAAVTGGTAVLLGRFYDDANRDSADGYFNVTAASGCDTSPDLDFTLGTVPSGWNDRVSSFQGYNNCTIKIWKDGNASGTSWGPASYADSLGTMNNQMSSATFY